MTPLSFLLLSSLVAAAYGIGRWIGIHIERERFRAWRKAERAAECGARVISEGES